MSKISLLAKLSIAEGKGPELEAAAGPLIQAANEEAGLEIYSLHKANDVDDTYYFFELYSDAAALEVHGKGDEMRAAMKALGGCLDGRPEITLMTPVAAKGMDL